MDLSADTILRGRYRIVQMLGQGGMGAVYLAYDLALEHEVAVKINRSPNPESAAQFIAEARLLASLRHANLPRVIDYFLEGVLEDEPARVDRGHVGGIQSAHVIECARLNLDTAVLGKAIILIS